MIQTRPSGNSEFRNPSEIGEFIVEERDANARLTFEHLGLLAYALPIHWFPRCVMWLCARPVTGSPFDINLSERRLGTPECLSAGCG